MKTQNTETKLNMLNHAVIPLPHLGSAGVSPASVGAPPNKTESLANFLWEYEPLKEAPAPGSVTPAYIEVRQQEAKRPKTREELRVNGADSESASASDAPADSQRTGGPASEAFDAKRYQRGDLPPNGGPGFSDNPSDPAQPSLTYSNPTPATSASLAPSPWGEGPSRPSSNRKPNPSPLDNIKPDNLDATSPSSAQSAKSADTSPLPQLSSRQESNPPFTLLQSDWIELSPYGDFAHPRGIQRVDRDAADRIVAQFNSFWAKLGRRFAGVPVYIGHPDVPDCANEYTDKKAYGWITELQARGSGLFAKVKWSNQGRDYIQNAHYKFYSPYWEAIYIGEKDGQKIYRPSNLLSVGLTNQPNLPVPPLANTNQGRACRSAHAASAPSDSFVNRRHRREEILTDSVAAANVSQFPPFSPVQSIQTIPVPLANEVLALQTLLRQRDERLLALHAQLENARSAWTSENARFENEIATLRAGIERLENNRIDIVLDHAMQQGRIAPAERDFWNEQLRRDFDIRHEELKQRPEVMHMRSVTGDLGKVKVDLSNAATRKAILFELLEAKQRSGLKYHDAWVALKEERPDLFAAMPGNH